MAPVPTTEKATRLPISILAPDPANPRRISDESATGLAISLETFGALDIVFNDETGELVSGHQPEEGGSTPTPALNSAEARADV